MSNLFKFFIRTLIVFFNLLFIASFFVTGWLNMSDSDDVINIIINVNKCLMSVVYACVSLMGLFICTRIDNRTRVAQFEAEYRRLRRRLHRHLHRQHPPLKGG